MQKLKLEELGLLPLSPSHLNRFVSDRAIWLMRKFFKLKSPYNINMLRGHAVEWGVEEGLKDKFKKIRHTTNDKGVIINHPVLSYYDKLVQDNSFHGEQSIKLRIGLPEMVNAAITELNKYGKLISAQDWLKFNIDIVIDGETYQIPFTGRTDFFMESEEFGRVLVDLKTTSRMPSTSVRYDTRLQQVLYNRATNFRTDLLYVGYGQVEKIIDGKKKKVMGPKTKIINVENDPKVLLRVQQTIIAMEKLLRFSDDRNVLKEIILPNPDDFMSWKDDEAYQMRKEIWGW